MDLVRWDVLHSLLALAARERLHISTVTESHERSRAAHSTATEDEELCSEMRHPGGKNRPTPSIRNSSKA